MVIQIMIWMNSKESKLLIDNLKRDYRNNIKLYNSNIKGINNNQIY